LKALAQINFSLQLETKGTKTATAFSRVTLPAILRKNLKINILK